VNNAKVVIDFKNYQLITTTNFIICLFLFILFIFYFLSKVKKFLIRPENFKKKIEKYSDFVAMSIIYTNIGDSRNANKFFKKSIRIFDNNLTKIVYFYILLREQKYIEADKIYKTIKINELDVDILKTKMDFETARSSPDNFNVEQQALKLLSIDSLNSVALHTLLKIYIEKEDWMESYKLFKRGLKAKIFNNKQDEFLLIYKNIAKICYENNNFNEAKEILQEVYKENQYSFDVVNLLSKIYLILNEKSKAKKIILKLWTKSTNLTLLDTYFLINDNEISSISFANNLLKANPDSFESNYAVARAYFFNKKYDIARKYIKKAEIIKSCKIVYEFLLNIEKETSNNQTMIGILKNKIANSQ
jgi:tetratricopeptide (TPR) repeat protein